MGQDQIRARLRGTKQNHDIWREKSSVNTAMLGDAQEATGVKESVPRQIESSPVSSRSSSITLVFPQTIGRDTAGQPSKALRLCCTSLAESAFWDWMKAAGHFRGREQVVLAATTTAIMLASAPCREMEAPTG